MALKTAIIRKKVLWQFLFLGLLITLFFTNSPVVSAQETLPQPYFLFPRDGNQTAANSKPIIRGETQNNTLVEIYIDDKLVGQAEVTNGPLFTAYFTYQITNNLRSGNHQIQAIAKDKTNPTLTNTSTKEYLRIIPFPAPTLFPLINESDNLILTGVAKNDSLINIYFNNQWQTNFQVINHPSGTAAFSWTTDKPLTLGKHTFYATARDPAGKLSLNSNVIIYQISTTETVQAKSINEETIKIEPEQKTNVIVEPTSEHPEPKVESVETTQPEIIVSEPSTASPVDEETTTQQETDAPKNKKSNFWLTVLVIVLIYITLRRLRKKLAAKKQEPPTTPKPPISQPPEIPKQTTNQLNDNITTTEPLWQPPEQTLPPTPKPPSSPPPTTPPATPPDEPPTKPPTEEPIPLPPEEPPLPKEPPPNNQLHYPF